MVRLVDEEGLRLDVATGGELHVALAAGFPPERLVFHGNNKSLVELRAARAAGVGRTVVDSFDELDRLDALAASGAGPTPKVLLRITPGVHAHTHEFIATGQDDSKFGFGLSAGDAQRAVDRAGASPSVELVGLHAHIGSQVFAVESFRAAIEVLAPFVRTSGLPELIIGGGLGVAYVEGEEAPTLSQWGHVLHAAAEQHGVPVPLAVEPSREPLTTGLLSTAAAGLPLSRSTRWARSRGSRACAPTSRSTGG